MCAIIYFRFLGPILFCILSATVAFAQSSCFISVNSGLTFSLEIAAGAAANRGDRGSACGFYNRLIQVYQQTRQRAATCGDQTTAVFMETQIGMTQSEMQRIRCF